MQGDCDKNGQLMRPVCDLLLVLQGGPRLPLTNQVHRRLRRVPQPTSPAQIDLKTERQPRSPALGHRGKRLSPDPDRDRLSNPDVSVTSIRAFFVQALGPLVPEGVSQCLCQTDRRKREVPKRLSGCAPPRFGGHTDPKKPAGNISCRLTVLRVGACPRYQANWKSS